MMPPADPPRDHVVVLGSSNTDMIVRVHTLPQAGETALGRDFEMAAGGKGANQAVAAARAGARVRFISCIGEDDFGLAARRGLQRHGIDDRHVVSAPHTRSGVALIFVDDRAENSIAVAPGANLALTVAHVEAAAPSITSAAYLLMQLESPLECIEAAARIAHGASVPVVLDPAPAQALPSLLLERTAILTPNAGEAEQLTGIEIRSPADAERAAGRLLLRGVASVIVTLGAGGAIWVTPDGSNHVAAHDIEAIDTTGAGDVFSGSLVAALAAGEARHGALEFANAAAALATTRVGAQPAIPSERETRDLLAASRS